MTFEAMFGPNTRSSQPKESTRAPRERAPRAPKGYETINGKVYKKAEGYYADRCPGSLVRIAWYRVRRNLGAAEYQCSFCGAHVTAEFQGSTLGFWNYPVHNRPTAPVVSGAVGQLPEDPPF